MGPIGTFRTTMMIESSENRGETRTVEGALVDTGSSLCPPGPSSPAPPHRTPSGSCLAKCYGQIVRVRTAVPSPFSVGVSTQYSTLPDHADPWYRVNV